MTPVRRAVATVAVLILPGLAVLGASGADRAPAPVSVGSDLPAPADLGQLVGRADLVVVGRVAHVEPGRVVGSGAPGAGLRTQLTELVVDEVAVGAAPDLVVVEEVAALADGRPATEGGAPPSRVGDAGLYLLVRGADATAPVGPHGRFLLDPDDPSRLVSPLPGDRLAEDLAALGPRRLRDAVIRTAAGP